MKGDSPLESELRIPKIFKEIRSTSTVSQIIWQSRARKSEVFDPTASNALSSTLRRGDEPRQSAPAAPTPPLPTTQLMGNRVEKKLSPQPSTSTSSVATTIAAKPVSPQPESLESHKEEEVENVAETHQQIVTTSMFPSVNSCDHHQSLTILPSTSHGNPCIDDIQPEDSLPLQVHPTKIKNIDFSIVENALLDEKVDQEYVQNVYETHKEINLNDIQEAPEQISEDKPSVVYAKDTAPILSENHKLSEEQCSNANDEEVDVDLLFRSQGISEFETCTCLHEPLKEFVKCIFSTSAPAPPTNSPEEILSQSKSILPDTSPFLLKNEQGFIKTEPKESTSRPLTPAVLDDLSEDPSSFPQSSFSPTFSDEPLSPESVSSDSLQVPVTPISPAWTELEDTVFGESTMSSMSTASIPLLKSIERLKLGIVQLRNFPMDNDDVQLVVNVKFDAQEVFQSSTVPSGANCIFGDETNCELPPKFHALHLVLSQMSDGGRLTRPIGRVSLRRKELINENDSFDGWMPIVKIACSQTIEILGDMCLDVSYDPKTMQLSVGVLDYTVWPLNTSTSTSQNQRLQETNLAKAGARSGRLYLRTCISSDKSLISSMKKSSVVERRTRESIRLDCSQLFSTKPSSHQEKDSNKSPPLKAKHHIKNDPKTLPPKPPKARTNQFATCNQNIHSKPNIAVQEDTFDGVGVSLSVSSTSASSSTATSPSWKMASTNLTSTPTPAALDAGGNRSAKTSGNFFFPSTSSPRASVVEKDHQRPLDSSLHSQRQLRLNIKVYNEATYDEKNSFCGYVRVPLDSHTLLPKNLPLGPNWFNIKSRTVNTALDTPLAELTTASSKTISNSKEHSLSYFRHTSSPSTSEANNHPLLTPPYHHTKTGSLGKSGVLATRSQPLRPAPSLASLRGLLTGNSSNVMGHCNPAASSSTKITGRDASVDSIARAMCNADKLGEMRLKLWYNVEEVLPFFHYQPLYTNLIKSLSVKPYSSSLTSLLSYLPIDMEHIAKPLMKIFVHAHQIRAFFRLVCSEYVSSCHDVNTLFRSQTMASKIMYELMKFVGHDYLVISLKPLIDLIYAERKCCEIDPSKLKPGDTLEQNLRNITVYAELTFSRVVDSYPRCPNVLREVFLELREVVHTHFPGRVDVARLALSSFLIMRFFAAAILNPKLFALKRDTPDADVCRTLVLVSKILQRLANCVVSSVPLTTKEQWLTPVLIRFSSDAHKTAMIDFLDGVSAVSQAHDHSSATNDENVSPSVCKESPVVLLKHGQMVERRSGTDKKMSFKNLIHQKRRYVTLTETQLSWQKVKDASTTPPAQQSGESPFDVDQHKGFALSEITAVSPLPEVKNSFRVATPSSEVHFQANNANEMNEWLIVIQKQQRRHIMQLNRPTSELNHLIPRTSKTSISAVVDVDMEREMQIIHSHFHEHLETLGKWKSVLENQDLDHFLRQLHSSGGFRGGSDAAMGLPFDKIFAANTHLDEQKICLAKLRETISTTIGAIEQIQAAHQAAKNLSYQMKLLQAKPNHQPESPNKTIGLDHIISSSSPTAMSGQKMVDSENYLHLRQRNKRIKKTAQFSAKMPPPALLQPVGEKNMLGVMQQPQSTNI